MPMSRIPSRDMRVVAAVALGCFAGNPVFAQAELFKCTDGVTTTYSSTACEKLGLKSSGAIRDRLTVIGNGPSPVRPEPAKAQPASKPPSTEEEEQRARRAAAGLKPINPLIDKLLK